jgi:hypothetical protein
MDIQIIDNFFPHKFFSDLQEHFSSHKCEWTYIPHTTYKGDGLSSLSRIIIWGDQIYDEQLYFYLKEYLTNHTKLSIFALMRIKVNAFFRTETQQQYEFHVDMPTCAAKYKTAVLYMNTNNGYTLFKDGTKIDSVANRIAIFDGDVQHATVGCTDQDLRMVMNLNWFEAKEDDGAWKYYE